MDKFEKYASGLVEQMTLDEKVSQMLHNSPAIDRLGIPAYNWWNEGLHGVARAGTATVFPQAIALAASFDEELVGRIASAVSDEARACFNMHRKYSDCGIYKGLTLWSPNVNIFRDPRWGRGHETYGEDPYLASRLGTAYVKGLQDRQKDGSLKTAACAKHFAVHSGPEELRHGFDAVVSKQDMAETYLPAFRALVTEAGVEAVMGAYNSVNGEPCCGNPYLLGEILRKRWRFGGHVVSDCWAVKDFHENHKVTGNAAESAALAVKSGCDLNCGSAFVYLPAAVREGLISEDEIDRAVIRLLAARARLGIIGDFVADRYDRIPYEENDSPKMRSLNLEAAKRCFVLLKNNGVLPLDRTMLKTIGVIGPNADSRIALTGNYCGTSSQYITVLDGIREYLGESVRVMYSEGCHLYKDRIEELAEPNDRSSEVRAICECSDVIIAVLGLDSTIEGEQGDTGNSYASGDKSNLDLPGLQGDILRIACESGKPVILLLLSGSALSVGYADENAAAVIQGWYPGAMGGRAAAELLFGEYSPSGKLPVTFYRTTDELPDFTDYSMKNRTYRYMKNEPLYPFGYGLSYTSFDITGVKASCDKITSSGAALETDVENIGRHQGICTVEVYVGLEKEGAPNPQLKGIANVSLQPGGAAHLSVELPLEAFAIADEEGIFRVYRGVFKVYIGESQPDSRSEVLMRKKPLEIQLYADEEYVETDIGVFTKIDSVQTR